jgi:tetratricopeptide (TPR) repeat protein
VVDGRAVAFGFFLSPAQGCSLSLALGSLLALALVFGCATRPLDRRDWVEVETPHFLVTSSLDRDATTRLAWDLERYRAAVGFLLGPGAAALPKRGPRARVYAFDGRGFDRPYAIRGASGAFVPDPDGGLIVLRTGGGWRGDATDELRHRFAHALFRSALGIDRPLWFDEGFAQLAAATELRDDADLLGRTPRSAARLLRGRILRSAAKAFPVEEPSVRAPGERDAFEAETGVLVQQLLLADGASRAARDAPHRYFASIERGDEAEAAFESAFGVSQSALIEQLADAVREDRFPSVAIRTAATKRPTKTATRPLGHAEVLTRLGWVSVELGRSEPAATYFGRAVSHSPGAARAYSGLGAVAALEGEWQLASEQHARAIGLAPDDAFVLAEAARDALQRATRSEGPSDRVEAAGRARTLYRRSLALDDSRAAAWIGLARSALVLGGSYVDEASEAVTRARALAPGSLEVALVRARVARAHGEIDVARRLASTVVYRTHDEARAGEACIVLEAIDRCDLGAPGRARPRTSLGTGEAVKDLCGLVGPEEREACR